jgi:hypothetical protein
VEDEDTTTYEMPILTSLLQLVVVAMLLPATTCDSFQYSDAAPHSLLAVEDWDEQSPFQARGEGAVESLLEVAVVVGMTWRVEDLDFKSY